MAKMLISPVYKINKLDRVNDLFYVVNDKDSLHSISEMYNLSTYDLKRINGLKDNKIYLGQVLKLKNKQIIKKFEKKNDENELKKENQKFILSDKKFTPVNVKPMTSDEKFPYEKSEYRDSYYMDFGFTTDIKLSDGLFYCLNGICWIEHHECYENNEQEAIKQHYVYVNTFYINKLGEVVLGKQIVLDFVTQAQKVPNGGFYAYEVKILSPGIKKTTYPYLSTGKILHDEIFKERKYKFTSGYIYDIADNDKSYNMLKMISIINRTTDTNAIYAAVQQKQEEVENILNIISVAAIPFEIPSKFTKYLQKGLEFLAYAIDLDGGFGFSDKFFDTRGPIPLSPIYLKKFRKVEAKDGYGNPIGGYEQIQSGKTEVYDEDFLMEEILVTLQEELLKNKS